MTASKKPAARIPKPWADWRMNPSDREAIYELLEVTWNLPFGYRDFVEVAELWPSEEVRQLFLEHGLDPEIDWRAVVASFHKSFTDEDRGRPRGTSRQIPIKINTLLHRSWKTLDLSLSSYKRILKQQAATKGQIRKMLHSRARLTLEDLGLPKDFHL